ncbi:translation initiation factor eIF3 subunit [Actinidia rufa]|uniref:Translation initiation factor eIF3 subunit n=1 Tax=Actinidia rufa TaxID=165716 RepID=A0A7J0DR10_9ERIC|nr:translation initiation factor eIF3 subunit [Actinidia rufa]
MIFKLFAIVIEEEAIPPLLEKEQTKNKWDDEDVDDNDVKESWEDEDEPAPAPAPEPPADKVPKKTSAKAIEQRGKTVEVAKEVPLDPVAEKLRQERLVEEADFRSRENCSVGEVMRRPWIILFPNLKKSFHYMGLLKAVMRLSMTSLKGADAKEVASSVTAIANEKIKAEKEANAGKKEDSCSKCVLVCQKADLTRIGVFIGPSFPAGTRKKQLHVDKPDDDVAVNAYDALDDDDFM